MDIDKFENERWSLSEQKIMFRHRIAAGFIDSGRVLDLGCGDGLFLDLLREKGVYGEGADISEVAVGKSRGKKHRAMLLSGEEKKLPFGNAEFDHVVLLDILEHLYKPNDFLIEAARISKKNVIISVPNFSSFPARMQALFGQVPENNKPNKGHIYWFNFDALNSILKMADLKITDLKINTLWENKPIIGKSMKIIATIFPKIFALSFVINAQKKDKNEK